MTSSFIAIEKKHTVDATTHLNKRLCPFVGPSRVIFERRIWAFLRVKTKKSSNDIIYSDDEVVASYVPPRFFLI